jgi:hypothetical protein
MHAAEAVHDMRQYAGDRDVRISDPDLADLSARNPAGAVGRRIQRR